MTLASLLAVIDGDSGSEAVVKAAIDLGRRFDALVELLHVQVPPQDALPMLGEGASGAMVEQVMQSAHRVHHDNDWQQWRHSDQR